MKIISLLIILICVFANIACAETTYYSSGRVESVTLSSPDGSGNIYYHYLDEDWANQGYGRLDKKIMAEADTDGARAVAYTYFETYYTTSQVQYESRYQNTDFTNIVSTYEYKPYGDNFYMPMPYLDFTHYPVNNFIIDFGSFGLWNYENNAWAQISAADPNFIIRGMESYDDVIVDFGPSYGIWKYSDSMWMRLIAESPKKIYTYNTSIDDYYILAYFESSGLCELTKDGLRQISPNDPEYVWGTNVNGDIVTFYSFGSAGTWKYEDGVLSLVAEMAPDPDPSIYSIVVVCDGASNPILIDFNSDGLWSYTDDEFTQISVLDPVYLDYFPGGMQHALIDFGETGGIWKYSNGSLIKLIDRGGVKYVTTSGSGDLIIDYGSSDGIWRYSDGELDKIFNLGGAQSCSTFGGEQSYRIVMDFGEYGLWEYENSAWTMISAYDMELGGYTYGNETYYDFGNDGLWKYSDNSLTQLSEWNPCSIYSLNNDGPLVDFGVHGLRQYKNGSWLQISPESPFLSNNSSSNMTYLYEKTLYERHPSGRLKTKKLPDGTEYEYDDTDVDDNGTPDDPSDDHGRLTKEKKADGSSKEYSNFYDTDKPGCIKEYDVNGYLTKTIIYNHKDTGWATEFIQIDNNFSTRGQTSIVDFYDGKMDWFDYSTNYLYTYNSLTEEMSSHYMPNNESFMYAQFDRGQMAWFALWNGGQPTSEIFYWNGTETIRLTNNYLSDEFPHISNGNIVWYNTRGSDDIWYYDGVQIRNLTNNAAVQDRPDILDGYTTWQGFSGGVRDIYLYDGATTRKLTNGIPNENIHTLLPYSLGNGRVIWGQMNGSAIELYCYNGSGIVKLSNNTGAIGYTARGDGWVVWAESDGNDRELYLYDGIKTIRLTDNNYDDNGTGVSVDGGRVVWSEFDGHDSELFLYDGHEVTQLTNNDYEDRYPWISGAYIGWVAGNNEEYIRFGEFEVGHTDYKRFTYEYQGGVILKERCYTSSDVCEKTIEYWSSGKKYREWIAEGVEGNDAYREYDLNGKLVKKTLGTADTDGAKAYVYATVTTGTIEKKGKGFGFGFGNQKEVEYQYSYANTDFTDLVATYELDSNGNPIKKIDKRQSARAIRLPAYIGRPAQAARQVVPCSIYLGRSETVDRIELRGAIQQPQLPANVTQSSSLASQPKTIAFKLR